jgi:hypothetical protein
MHRLGWSESRQSLLEQAEWPFGEDAGLARANCSHSLSKPHGDTAGMSHNFQPQRSHLNCSSGFALAAVLPQCGHFIVHM